MALISYELVDFNTPPSDTIRGANLFDFLLGNDSHLVKRA